MIDGFQLGDFDLDSFFEQEEITQTQEKPSEQKYQLVFAIDASNSMMGYKIGAVNETVNNAISKIKAYSKSQNGNVEVCVIGFSNKLFKWTEGFVPIESFKFSYVEMVDKKTEVSALFEELTNISNESMNIASKKIVIFFTDGLPTCDYSEAIIKWQTSKNYSETFRIAVSFDEDISDPQSKEFLTEFVNGGNILTIKNHEELIKLLL